ncbi:MAG: adenosine deaminase [Chloroflexota bacterium]|nr:MAG: adenosine deaminase [Chloroflexota bacterium]
MPLAELHAHLGGSVAPPTMWTLLHRQGLANLPKDYWSFEKAITVSPEEGVADLAAYDRIFHLTERIQSSPMAMELSVHDTIGGAYRHGVECLELRYNPMKRNLHGTHPLDLDHIIMASSRGLDTALLEYPQMRAGLILMMDRTFDYELNAIIVQKALRYRDRGIVGIDVAGPPQAGFSYRTLAPLIEEARQVGLGITIHTGEEGSIDDVWEVVEYLHPQRIGHGILSAHDQQLMDRLVRDDIVLEICPTSNLLTHAVRDLSELRWILHRLRAHGVRFTINTDGPEMLCTSLRREYDLLLSEGMLDDDSVRTCNTLAHEVSFVRGG